MKSDMYSKFAQQYDEAVQVTFYRRPLMEIANGITSAGLSITQISEGQVSEAIKQASQQTYGRLSKNPNCIFIKCQK